MLGRDLGRASVIEQGAVTVEGLQPRFDDLRVLTGGATSSTAQAEVRRAKVWDGLPMADPTADRVVTMLAGRSPHDPVPAIPPLFLPAVVEDVAVCAVLAGCSPAAIPYLLTAVNCAAEPGLNLIGVATTTGNAALGMVVHGPARDDSESRSGANCLGGLPGNSALGRAFALCSRLLGGASPGTVDMATLGQPAKLSLCTAEGVPPAGWEPLHAARGLPVESSAVTVFASSGVIEVADTESVSARDLLETLAAALVLPAALNASGDVLGGGEQVVLLPPEWAARLAAEGWTRETIGAFLYDRATLPIDRLPPNGRRRITHDVIQAGLIRSARSAKDFLVVVAGGVGMKAACLPSWPGGSTSSTRELV